MFRFLTPMIAALIVFSTPAYAADKSGKLSGLEKAYPVRGTVVVSKDGTIRLTGFKSASGPDLYIYVGNGRPSHKVAKLKRLSGNQTYKISAKLAASISTVHVHCKRFNHLYGTARVK